MGICWSVAFGGRLYTTGCKRTIVDFAAPNIVGKAANQAKHVMEERWPLQLGAVAKRWPTTLYAYWLYTRIYGYRYTHVALPRVGELTSSAIGSTNALHFLYTNADSSIYDCFLPDISGKYFKLNAHRKWQRKPASTAVTCCDRVRVFDTVNTRIQYYELFITPMWNVI